MSTDSWTHRAGADPRGAWTSLAIVVGIAMCGEAVYPPRSERASPPLQGRLIPQATCEAERWVLGCPMCLNLATADELALLPGVGAHGAAAVVGSRGGGYRSWRELAVVPRLSKVARKALEAQTRLEPSVCCRGAESSCGGQRSMTRAEGSMAGGIR